MANELLSLTPSIQALIDKYRNYPMPLTRAAFQPVPESERLADVTAGTLFPLARSSQAALSGLLLLLNHWDASHRLSQEIDTADGSYWHAIAHRIEPDSFNSSYWFRRVGSHPVYPELHAQASAVLAHEPRGKWYLKTEWNPSLFIDWCEQAREQPGTPFEAAAVSIQKVECQLLFAWCSQAANTGRAGIR